MQRAARRDASYQYSCALDHKFSLKWLGLLTHETFTNTCLSRGCRCHVGWSAVALRTGSPSGLANAKGPTGAGGILVGSGSDSSAAEADGFPAVIDHMPVALIMIFDPETVAVGPPVGPQHWCLLLDPIVNWDDRSIHARGAARPPQSLRPAALSLW